MKVIFTCEFLNREFIYSFQRESFSKALEAAPVSAMQKLSYPLWRKVGFYFKQKRGRERQWTSTSLLTASN